MVSSGVEGPTSVNDNAWPGAWMPLILGKIGDVGNASGGVCCYGEHATHRHGVCADERHRYISISRH